MSDVQLTKLPMNEMKDRLRRVRSDMSERGLELGLAYGNEYTPGDVQYLTGYDPQIEAAAVLITADEMVVLGGPEGRAMFDDQEARGRWLTLNLFEVPFQDYGSLKFYSMQEVLKEMGVRSVARIGLLTDRKYVPVGLMELFHDHDSSIVDATEVLAQARYEKSPLELELFERAARVASDAVRAMRDALIPGMSELDVAAIGDAAVKSGGAYSYGWDTMVLSGPRTDSIIGRASNKVIRSGELVVLGAAPRYAGYCATVGRTVVAGSRPSDSQKRLIEAGSRALELAAERFFEGVPAAAVDAAAREFLATAGFGPYHAYGVGHGIGFSECLELRTATSKSDYEFPRGISMMLDVGIFGHPEGLNGRFEDPYVIDHEGRSRRLTDLPIRIGLE